MTSLAAAALFIWPIVALFIGRRLPFDLALIWCIVLPYLFLPEAYEIELPVVPDIDKFLIISIGVVGLFLTNRSALPPAPEETEARLLRLLLLAALIMTISAPLLTVLNNGETLRFGPTVVPGLPLKEGVTEPVLVALWLVPYFFARRYLATPEAHRKILTVLVIMGLFYSLLMLVEMRFSPQLHRLTYGYHQHIFTMHIRNGDFRPMMFLQHGLFVGFFICTCFLAALGLWKGGQGKRWLLAAGWLYLILTQSENLGAMAIGTLVGAVYLLTGRWIQILFAMGVGITIFLFPIFRGAGLIPVDQVTSLAAMVSEERAQSFGYRLGMEDMVMERALERPVTGWGRWGRNQVYNERGEVISVQEGVWIQAISETGWYGYLGLFGVLTLPAMFFVGVWRRKKIPPETFVVIIITTGNLIYMIPTTLLTPISWMLFGALTGFALTRAEEARPETGAGEPEVPVSRYTRFAQSEMAPDNQHARPL